MNETTKNGIIRYVENGTPPGEFLFAVLSNDLKESFGKADLENRRDMFEIVSFCYNYIPIECWGSEEKVNAWLEKKAEERSK